LLAVEKSVEGMEGRITTRIDTGLANVAGGFNVALDAAAAGIRAHIDARFGETMRKCQEVTDERAKVAAL
jgi:hypothetical protein